MHLPHLHFHYALKKEINEIYIMNSLNTFALSSVGIFVPIFLLEKGYPLVSVLFFLLLDAFLNIPSGYLALKHASLKGVHRTILYSVPLMVTFFLMLYNINFLGGFLSPVLLLTTLALVRSLAVMFYCMGFHVEFAKHSQKVIKQIGTLRALSTIFSVIGPLFGGLVITLFSFNALFGIVVAALILSVVPLFFSDEEYESFEFSLKNIEIDRGQAVPFLAEGFRDSAAKYFWPILMSTLMIPVASIGGVYTVSRGLLAFFMLYLGRKTTDTNKRKILWIGTVGNALSLGARALLKTLAPIIVVQGIGGLAWTMVQLPFHSIFYENSKQKGVAYMVYFRELFLNLGRMGSISLLMVLVLLKETSVALTVTIASAAVVMLLMGTIKDIQARRDAGGEKAAQEG